MQRYEDRVSTSFCEDTEDVDCIVTVTHDMRVVGALDDQAIIALARKTLSTYSKP